MNTDSLKNLFKAIIYAVREIQADLRFIYVSQILKIFFFMSLVIRIFFLAIFHSNQPSPFAPDEETYARLAEYVSLGVAVQDFPYYGPSLYNQSKSLIIPSSLLIKLGLDPLESVRIVSAIYGFFVPLFALLCFVAIAKSSANFEKINFKLMPTTTKILFIFLFFLPSNFLWSTLGLRESTSQFWILAQTYFMIKFYKEVKYPKLIFAFLTIFSSVFSFAARPQTALLMSIFLIFLSFVVALRTRTISFLLVSIFCMISGNAFSSTPEVKFIQKWTIVEKTDGLGENTSKNIKGEGIRNSDEANSLCSFPQQIIEDSKNGFECVLVKEYRKNFLPPITFLPQSVDIPKLEEIRNENRVGARSALAPSYCSKFLDEIASIKCNVSQLPYRLSAFLLRPFLFLDEGSPFLLFASLENFVWLFMFIVSIANLARLRSPSLFKDYILIITLFLILFSTSVSLYEGNMGTAFRHKSTLVGHLILLNLLAMWSHKIRTLDFKYGKTM